MNPTDYIIQGFGIGCIFSALCLAILATWIRNKGIKDIEQPKPIITPASLRTINPEPIIHE